MKKDIGEGIKRQQYFVELGLSKYTIFMVPLQPYYFALYCHELIKLIYAATDKLCLGQYVVSTTGRLPKKSVVRQAHNAIQVAYSQMLSTRTSYSNITLPSTNKTLSSYLN